MSSLGTGDFFGEMALLNDDPRAATVTASSTVLSCLVLKRHTFVKLFGPLQERLNHAADERKAVLNSTKFEDLKVHGVIGAGSFGHVNLCVHTPTNQPYALKAMIKARAVARSQVEHVFSEREVLRLCSHSFIVHLAATFQDAKYVYMLLECARRTRARARP